MVSTGPIEGLFGFHLIEGAIFVALLQPILPDVRHPLIFNVLGFGLFGHNPALALVGVKRRQDLALGQLLGLVLSHNSRSQLVLICLIGENPRSFLLVGPHSRCIEESLGQGVLGGRLEALCSGLLHLSVRKGPLH